VAARQEATCVSLSLPGEPAGGQGGLDLSAVAGIARCPTPLVIVEVSQEPESLTDKAFPCDEVDRLRELADRLRSEVLFTAFSENIGGVEGSVPRPSSTTSPQTLSTHSRRTRASSSGCPAIFARSYTSRPSAVRL